MTFPLSSFTTHRSDLSDNTINDIFEQRYNVFYKRLNWEVSTTESKEVDEFDSLNPVYVVSKSNNKVAGSMRLLPTTGRYMLKDTFPEALDGDQAPTESTVWEISRFFVDKNQNQLLYGTTNHTIELMRSAYFFAVSNSITQFVLVTTVAIERYMNRIGFKTERFGEGNSVYLGKERSVALKLNIDEEYYRAVMNS